MEAVHLQLSYNSMAVDIQQRGLDSRPMDHEGVSRRSSTWSNVRTSNHDDVNGSHFWSVTFSRSSSSEPLHHYPAHSSTTLICNSSICSSHAQEPFSSIHNRYAVSRPFPATNTFMFFHIHHNHHLIF